MSVQRQRDCPFAGLLGVRNKLSKDHAATNQLGPIPVENARPFAANSSSCRINGSGTRAGEIFDERARRQFLRECEKEGLAKGRE